MVMMCYSSVMVLLCWAFRSSRCSVSKFFNALFRLRGRSLFARLSLFRVMKRYSLARLSFRFGFSVEIGL